MLVRSVPVPSVSNAQPLRPGIIRCSPLRPPRSRRQSPCPELFTERLTRSCQVRPLSYATAYRGLREAIAQCNSLKGTRFHDLRHTFATERAQIVPLEVLRALLGHEKIQTTLLYQKITSRVARESAQEALDHLAKSWSGNAA